MNNPEITNPILVPKPGEERIVALDALRGFALLGILLVNIMSFSGINALSEDPAGAVDQAVQGFIKFFLQAKFLSLFALLFGISFTLQLARLRETGVGMFPTYWRRLVVLFLFGMLHTLLDPAEVLAVYALCGSLLLLFWKAPCQEQSQGGGGASSEDDESEGGGSGRGGDSDSEASENEDESSSGGGGGGEDEETDSGGGGGGQPDEDPGQPGGGGGGGGPDEDPDQQGGSGGGGGGGPEEDPGQSGGGAGSPRDDPGPQGGGSLSAEELGQVAEELARIGRQRLEEGKYHRRTGPEQFHRAHWENPDAEIWW